jgi:hypothetical protein
MARICNDFSDTKTLLVAYYNAGVVVVNSQAVGVRLLVIMVRCQCVNCYFKDFFLLMLATRKVMYNFQRLIKVFFSFPAYHQFPTLSLEHPNLSQYCLPIPTLLSYSNQYPNYLRLQLRDGEGTPDRQDVCLR